MIESDADLAAAIQEEMGETHVMEIVPDVETAYGVLEDHMPDLVLLDLALPGGDGIYLLDFLNGLGTDIPPVVVMGSRARDPELVPFQHLIAAALTKPVPPGRLAQVLESALGEWQPPSYTPDEAEAPLVLLAESDSAVRTELASALRQAGIKVTEAQTLDETLRLLGARRFDVLVSQWVLSGGTARRLLEQTRSMPAGPPVVILAANPSPPFLQRVLALGAADLLAMPVAPAALLIALEKQRSRSQPARLSEVAEHRRTAPGITVRQRNVPRYGPENIIGVSPVIQRARAALKQVARMDSTVLLVGETGSGKELFAQALHNLSARRAGAFVAVNAAAIPESLLESELFGYGAGAFTGAKRDGHRGKFLQATGGTLFLDEIGDLPLALQAKLLRVLQEGEIDPVGGLGPIPVDVRLVAATHRDLSEMVRQGTFRSDLYFRLNVVTIPIPPLRERTEDVAPLAESFLADLCHRYDSGPKTFSEGSLERLRAYTWPGNVRELRNVVEQAFVFSPGAVIHSGNLPVELQAPTAKVLTLVERSVPPAPTEREAIQRALVETGGNKARAARLLGISRAGLYVKLKVYGLG